MKGTNVPTFDAMMNPLLQALKSLGGSGTVEEIESKVAEVMGLSDDQLELLHNPEKGDKTEFGYRLAWTRTYLKRANVLENSVRGIWALTPQGSNLDRVDEKQITKAVRGIYKDSARQPEIEEPEEVPRGPSTWRSDLLDILLRIPPAAFERLTQRMLRESGFVQVEVTGRTGDGGIDGNGIIRLGGLLSFYVIFQCKRWKNPVGPSQMRDFRGAMIGRADKGLFITTGTFTKEAVREATRDGAPTIDLIDGERLLDKLKELSLGVRTRRIEIEEVTLDRDWYSGL